MGEKWSDNLRLIYGIENLPASQWGFEPSKITNVILTNIHFDHAGGISKYIDAQQKELELCYPKATIHLQADNLMNAKNPTIKERASYLKENWAPVEKAKLNIINGTNDIYPGIRGHQVNGHTAGQQWIEIYCDHQAIFYPTDLIPTSHHVPRHFIWAMIYAQAPCLRKRPIFWKPPLKERL